MNAWPSLIAFAGFPVPLVIVVVILVVVARALSSPYRLGRSYRYTGGSGVVAIVILLVVFGSFLNSNRSEHSEDRENQGLDIRVPTPPAAPKVPAMRVVTRQQGKHGSPEQSVVIRPDGSMELSSDDGEAVVQATIGGLQTIVSALEAASEEKPVEAAPAPTNGAIEKSDIKKSEIKTGEIKKSEPAHQPVEVAQKANGDDTTQWQPAIAVGGRPAWVDAPPAKVDGVFYTKASSGPNATRTDCEDALDKDLRKVVRKYVEDLSGDEDMGGIDVPLSYIKKNLVLGDLYEERIETSVGPMVQLHALLAFDARVQGELKDRGRDAVVTRRLKSTAGVSAAVLALLATAFGYLKIDLLTAGRYRWRLRLAALAIPAVIWLAWVTN